MNAFRDCSRTGPAQLGQRGSAAYGWQDEGAKAGVSRIPARPSSDRWQQRFAGVSVGES
jgi:hypothetical protein